MGRSQRGVRALGAGTDFTLRGASLQQRLPPLCMLALSPLQHADPVPCRETHASSPMLELLWQNQPVSPGICIAVPVLSYVPVWVSGLFPFKPVVWGSLLGTQD